MYNVKFDQPVTAGNLPAFGVKYTFTLDDAVDSVPEYLVHPMVLAELGKEFDLELVEITSFSDFKEENYHHGKNKNLWQMMKVSPISFDEWEAITIYDVFSFRKIRGPAPPTHQNFPEAKRMEVGDVISVR